MPRCAWMLLSVLLAAWCSQVPPSFSQVPPANATRPSERLLPQTTKGYVSIPNVDELRKNWDESL